MKGLVLYKIGNFTDANKIYDKIISNDIAKNFKQTSLVLYSKGMILYQLLDYQKAIILFNQALKFDSKNSNIYFYKGESQYSLGNYEEALKSYEQAILLNPNDNRPLIKKELIINHLGVTESLD
jgi:tetratricopeptide (TPR) repeat protein